MDSQETLLLNSSHFKWTTSFNKGFINFLNPNRQQLLSVTGLELENAFLVLLDPRLLNSQQSWAWELPALWTELSTLHSRFKKVGISTEIKP